jgi:eukaryotic-like serine/threonine-protein kinase
MSLQPAERPPDPLLGQLFAGKYRMRRLIARGAMGRVYEAEHELLRRRLAIKILSLTARQGHDGDRERFSREASLLARLTHENTVRVFDHGVDQGLSYIVMEYIDGVTLRTMLADGRIDPLRAIRIARQICGSLAEAHDLGLVHRDLKPANVMVSETPEGPERVKVVDLGLVKELEDAVHMTAEGELLGTPLFMAPEQIRGEPLDRRVDVYALGVLLYRCFTGDYPWPTRGTAPILLAHLKETPRSFREVAPDLELPHPIEWVVLCCLEKEPQNRFANVREVSRALALCEAMLLDDTSASFDGLTLVDGRLAVTAAPPARSRRALLLVGLLAASALLLAATLGFALAAAALPPPQAAVVGAPSPLPAPAPPPEVPPLPAPSLEGPPPVPRPPALQTAPRVATRPPVEPTARAVVVPPATVAGTDDLKDPWADGPEAP